jgi:uncharacterized phage-associated protein
MASAHDVANYFLTLQTSEDSGDLISNLKLQKLLYYAQGYHLAMYDAPLFPQTIRAWKHGPVVPDIWVKYTHLNAGAIPLPEDYDPSKLTGETKTFLDEVYDVVGQFSAWKLRNMTHEEPPWKETPGEREITHDRLKSYFKTLLNTDGKEAV